MDATLDDRELEGRLLFIPAPFFEPTLRPGFLFDREAGVDFLLPVFRVGVGDLDPPRDDAGVERRDPFRELGVSERSLSGRLLFFLFLAANISFASSSSAAAASAACALADFDLCLALLLPYMTQTLTRRTCVSLLSQHSSAENFQSQHLIAIRILLLFCFYLIQTWSAKF